MTKQRDMRPIFQGDCMLIPVDAIPHGALAHPIEAVNGVYVLAHSETGHHHVVKARDNVRFFREPGAELTSWLEVERIGGGDGGAALEHLRSFDTHPPVDLDGAYRVKNARERAPEGWRRAQD